MSHSSFYVVYDGPALAANQMDVRDLAPALLALGEVLEEANRAINGERTKVSLNVRASFKTGCFGIEFDVVQGLLDQAVDLFRGSPVATAKELVEYIGFVATPVLGLVEFIKWLRGRQIKEVVLLDNGKVRVLLEGDAIETEEAVLELYRQFRLRQALEKVIADPLSKEGIESFAASVSANAAEFIEVDRESAWWYRAPETPMEEIEDREDVVSLQLVNVAFRDDNKWRFSDGSNVFHAAMLDDNFLNRVNLNEESFSKGDILRVRLRKRQWIAGADIKSEYHIQEVLHHRRAGAQLRLPISNPPKDDADSGS